MAPQRLEKIKSAPGIGIVSEASNPQDLVRGGAADRARIRLTSRKNDRVAKLQKKAPNVLKSLYAKLKSAPVPEGSPRPRPTDRLRRRRTAIRWPSHKSRPQRNRPLIRGFAPPSPARGEGLARISQTTFARGYLRSRFVF